MRYVPPLAAVLLWPGVGHAEVADKIPTQTHLDAVLFVHLALAALAGFLPRRPYVQVAVTIALSLHGLLYVSELVIGDLGSAVGAEMGAAYVATVWLLVGAPAVVTGTGLAARSSH